jgi:hypothetical protein
LGKALYTHPPGISEHEVRANPSKINLKALYTHPTVISEHEMRANPFEINLKALLGFMVCFIYPHNPISCFNKLTKNEH